MLFSFAFNQPISGLFRVSLVLNLITSNKFSFRKIIFFVKFCGITCNLEIIPIVCSIATEDKETGHLGQAFPLSRACLLMWFSFNLFLPFLSLSYSLMDNLTSTNLHSQESSVMGVDVDVLSLDIGAALDSLIRESLLISHSTDPA